MPLVTVIIPTYNRESYLKETIECVQKQTFQDMEIIIIDDGSTDNTRGVVESYAKQDSRIQYLWQANNIGTAGAGRNRAIKIAKGKYIAFLDDDDRWLPEKIKRQVTFMEANPEIGFCYVRFQIYQKKDGQLEKGKLFPHYLADKFEDMTQAFIAPSSTMFRTRCLQQTQGFSIKYWPCDDFALWLEFGQKWKFAPIDEVLTYTVMDGRTHGAQDEMKVYKTGIHILRELKLIPPYHHHQGWVKQQIAFRFYEIGRMYLDRAQYWSAAQNFIWAVLTDPLVGLRVQRQGEAGLQLFIRVFKSYIAIPACIVKGLFYGRR